MDKRGEKSYRADLLVAGHTQVMRSREVRTVQCNTDKKRQRICLLCLWCVYFEDVSVLSVRIWGVDKPSV
jgi:hypothetical protein